jgi:hypothetical protein
MDVVVRPDSKITSFPKEHLAASLFLEEIYNQILGYISILELVFQEPYKSSLL